MNKKLCFFCGILFLILVIGIINWDSEYIYDTFFPCPFGEPIRERKMNFSDSEIINYPFMGAIVNFTDIETQINCLKLSGPHIYKPTILIIENVNNIDKYIQYILKGNNIILGIENYSRANFYMYFAQKFNFNDVPWYRVTVKTKSKKDSSIRYEDFLVTDVNLLCNVLKKNNVPYISEFDPSSIKDNDNKLLYLYSPKTKIKVTIRRLEKYSFNPILDSKIIKERI